MTERQLLESHEQPRGRLSAVFPGPTPPLRAHSQPRCMYPVLARALPRWRCVSTPVTPHTARFGHDLKAPQARLCPGGSVCPTAPGPHCWGALLPAPASASPLLALMLAPWGRGQLHVEDPHSPRVTLTRRRRRINGCSPGGVPRRRPRGRGSGTGPVQGTRGRLEHGAAAGLRCPQGCSFPWAVSLPCSEQHSPSHTYKPEQPPSNTTTGRRGAILYIRARTKTKKTPGASILHSTWLLSTRPCVQPRLCLHNTLGSSSIPLDPADRLYPGTHPAWEWTWPAQKTVFKQPLWVANLPKTFNPIFWPPLSLPMF